MWHASSTTRSAGGRRTERGTGARVPALVTSRAAPRRVASFATRAMFSAASASAPVALVAPSHEPPRENARRDAGAGARARVVASRRPRRPRLAPRASAADADPDALPPLDIAIVGAGFAGVATAWHVVHLLATDGDGDAAPTASAVDPAVPAVPRRPVRLRLFDEKGIAGGASGVAAGLLHPYTPRGKIIWRGVEGVAATLRLVDAAEAAERALDAGHAHLPPDPTTATARRGRAIAWRKGTVRPARNAKQARDLARHAPAAAEAGGRGVSLDADALRRLLPGIRVPAEVERGDDADDTDDTDDTAKASTLKNGARSARQEREAREAAEARRAAPRAAALHVPEGLVLDSSRYLAALWDATRLLASSDAVPAGTSATFHVRTVTALDDDPELASCDAVVVACGAAAESVSELAAAGLPTALQGGHVVELTRPTGEAPDPSAWDDGRPGILGSPYVAPLGPERLLVGTTREYDATVATARRAGARDPKSDAVAAAAAEKLTRDVTEVYPPLRNMSVDAVRYGVRANPPRRALGSLPLVGRVRVGEETETETDGDGDGTRATRRTRWYVGGLGARGLVYHGMVGEMVARAALTGDGGGIPRELRYDPGGEKGKDA